MSAPWTIEEEERMQTSGSASMAVSQDQLKEALKEMLEPSGILPPVGLGLATQETTVKAIASGPKQVSGWVESQTQSR